MNYELAKKLYSNGTFKSPIPVTEANQKYLDYPSLSELIEACGDKFILLERLQNGRLWECVPCDKFGKTPEEAVSNLWLQINYCPS